MHSTSCSWAFAEKTNTRDQRGRENGRCFLIARPPTSMTNISMTLFRKLLIYCVTVWMFPRTHGPQYPHHARTSEACLFTLALFGWAGRTRFHETAIVNRRFFPFFSSPSLSFSLSFSGSAAKPTAVRTVVPKPLCHPLVPSCSKEGPGTLQPPLLFVFFTFRRSFSFAPPLSPSLLPLLSSF